MMLAILAVALWSLAVAAGIVVCLHCWWQHRGIMRACDELDKALAKLVGQIEQLDSEEQEPYNEEEKEVRTDV